MTRPSRVVEPGYDIDLGDPEAGGYNRLATGMIDEPAEIPFTAADVLAITSAESVVLNELGYILFFEPWLWWGR